MKALFIILLALAYVVFISAAFVLLSRLLQDYNRLKEKEERDNLKIK